MSFHPSVNTIHYIDSMAIAATERPKTTLSD
jgi:hypothetical protein